MFIFCASVVLSYDKKLDQYIPIFDRPRVIDKTYYITVYNPDRTIKFVAWVLIYDRSIIGQGERSGMTFPWAVRRNFVGSNLDIGHLCPAQDMAWLLEAMQSTFDVDNQVPQTKRFNRGLCRSLETQCRKWALNGQDFVIMTGPLYRAKPSTTIGIDKISVPTHCWKLVINLFTRETLGYIFPNTPDVSGVPVMFKIDPATIKKEVGL